ncbi:hypothetical protein [Streptomyces cacaoi]|uniref:Uncharacterized protein n=1 Tax=Streptomyces cacaoi TaxID=1898 RepID=A0A4Y3QYD7_STRCI|nr:hypothetical protein [Streptomyces cacaoi]GEB50435.1 hypothetical protein SCA03_29860 [Streptomyces cacaoi]
MTAVAELIGLAGGETALSEICGKAGAEAARLWPRSNAADLGQSIAAKTIVNAGTLVRGMSGAQDPRRYLYRSAVTYGHQIAADEAQEARVAGWAFTSSHATFETARGAYGPPEGVYSTAAVRSALPFLGTESQNDPLMLAVEENLPRLSQKDRDLIFRRLVDGERVTDRKAVTRAVDRLTRFINDPAR